MLDYRGYLLPKEIGLIDQYSQLESTGYIQRIQAELTRRRSCVRRLRQTMRYSLILPRLAPFIRGTTVHTALPPLSTAENICAIHFVASADVYWPSVRKPAGSG